MGSTRCRHRANPKPTPSHSLGQTDVDKEKGKKRDSTKILSSHSGAMTSSLHSCYFSQFTSSSARLITLQFKFRETLKISGSSNLGNGSKETVTRNIVQQVLIANCNGSKDGTVNPIFIKLTENTGLYSHRYPTSRRNY